MTTKRSARRLPRVFYTVAVASVVALTVAGPVRAAETSSFFSNVPAYPIKSACVGRTYNDGALISWRGGEEWYSYYWDPRITAPRGAMYFCYATYRLGQKTADGDYYAVDLRTVWRPDSSATWTFMPAVGRMTVSSNKTAKDYIFEGTNDYTSNQNCDSAVTVGVGIGAGITVGTSMRICSGETVDRTSNTATGASWRGDQVHRMKTMETAYVQKVAHGAVPTFTMTFLVPYYTYEYIGFPTYWKVTPQWDTYTVVATGTV